MNGIIEKLSLQNTRPIYVQIAHNGKWEEILKAPLNRNMGYLDYKKDFSDPSERIAVELFYELNDGRHVFLGLRYNNTLSKVSSPVEFLDKFIELLPVIAELPLLKSAEKIGQELAGNSNLLLGDNISFLELGVCDWWLSEGSKRIWEQGEPQLTLEELKNKLSEQRQLLVNKKNYVALEIAFNEPEHWFGIEVSKHVNDEYRLDTDRIIDLARVVTTTK